MLEIFVKNLLTEDPTATVEIKRNEKEVLQAIFIQTTVMRNTYAQFGNLIHIDSTFSLNLENFQAYICVAENNNLNARPVAYCFLQSAILPNLEFFYNSMDSHNDLRITEIIVVDKDLTNIDLLSKYFKNEKLRILLCSFHTLKYIRQNVLPKVETEIEVKHSLNEKFR